MRALAILAAAAMVISLFLPWLSQPVMGSSFAPWEMLKNQELSLEGLQRTIDTLPVEMLLVLATFPLAALFLVLAVLGLPSRLLALITGAIPVGMVGYAVLRARDGLASSGIPLPNTGDLQQIFTEASKLLGSGAWAWGGGALVLLLTGLIGFARR